ncbi:hypothetical protein ACN9JG_12290 [Cereibacter azotoformans]|uniref:hypothetical protein n=1 Tax=Cereibacter azotoformans TaxID=43057 RepID=UPI003B20E776
MAIDPDITPFLDALAARIAGLETQLAAQVQNAQAEADGLAAQLAAVRADLLALGAHASDETADLLARLAALETALPGLADSSSGGDNELSDRLNTLSRTTDAGDAALSDRLVRVQDALDQLENHLTGALNRISQLEGTTTPDVGMADLFEDGTGGSPEGWRQVWNALPWIEAQGCVQAEPTSTARSLLACDAADGAVDIETLALFTFAEAGGFAGLAVRAAGAAARETGYRVMFNNNGSGPSLQVVRFNEGTATILSNLAFARAAEGDCWLRVRMVGATLSWKAWAATANEPAAWTGTLTDTSPITTGGWAGLCAGGGNGLATVRCQRFSWAFDGASAAPVEVAAPAGSGGTLPAPVEANPWELLGTLPLPVIAYDDPATRTVHVPPGQRYAHIKVTADQPVRMTAILRPFVQNSTGGGINVGSDQSLWVGDYWHVWRPDDDPEMWITIDMRTTTRTAGQRFLLYLHTDMGGWRTASPVSAYIEIKDGAVNEPPAVLPRHRPPMRLDITGTPTAQLDAATARWSDTGYIDNSASGTPCWRSRLSHGYTQDGNAEVGLYMNEDVWPTQSAFPHARVSDGQGRTAIRLRSCRLPAPVTYNSTRIFYHQASVLIGQRMPEWRGKTGIWTARCVTSSRKFSWPAFWLIAEGWPPEIDVFEHFNSIYGSWPDGGWSTCNVHSGEYGSLSVRTRAPLKFDLRKLGFDSFDAYSEIHDYAVLVTRERIYCFIDGIEVYCGPNGAKHQNWDANWSLYPMFDVAAKFASPDSYAYSDGSGDMHIYSAARYETSAASLVPVTDARPWPNGKQLPDPTY